ncbi:MAG: proline--tRNA ligase [Chlamydia sp.]
MDKRERPLKKERVAIQPTRCEDYAEWYQQIIKASDIAENSPVRGCMVIKPWGWAIWERIRDRLDRRIKETGHSNAYFPLFVPVSFLEKEADHVEGFAKECAVVTHHRLEAKDGRLMPAGELEEPLVVRPTSETVIGDAFSRWVNSWRDLPLKINQWANVVRWEMRPRIFLRTTEFLWQEGHTAHASVEEAKEETLLMLEEYRSLTEEFLALPVIVGEKSPGERFPGAEHTYTIEAMTQDRKALQCGTSHYLGQNFSKAFNIRFNTKQGDIEYAYTTSWGVTTRLIGAVIMAHSDDNGLVLPPRIVPYHVVIIPILLQEERNLEILENAKSLQKELKASLWDGEAIRVHIDDRDIRSGEKSWEWIKKGVPLRIEIGPKDLDQGLIQIARRFAQGHDEPFYAEALPKKELISYESCCSKVLLTLTEMQQEIFDRAKRFQEEHVVDTITNFEELKAFFSPKNENRPEIHGGFVLGRWCQDPETEELLKDLKIAIRCIPLHQRTFEIPVPCVITGRPGIVDAIFAKSY